TSVASPPRDPTLSEAIDAPARSARERCPRSARLRPGRLREELLGVGHRAFALLEPGEHPRELSDAAGIVEDVDRCRPRVLADPDVAIGEARDLRKVRDDEHLAPEREPRESPTDRQTGLAPDPGVDLVEDEGGDLVEVGEDAAARQHRARELATRGGLREGQRLVSGDGRESKLDPLASG